MVFRLATAFCLLCLIGTVPPAWSQRLDGRGPANADAGVSGPVGGAYGEDRPFQRPGRYGRGSYGGGERDRPYGEGEFGRQAARPFHRPYGPGRFGGPGPYGDDDRFGRGDQFQDGRYREGDGRGDAGARWPRRPRPPFGPGGPYGPRDPYPGDDRGPPVDYAEPDPRDAVPDRPRPPKPPPLRAAMPVPRPPRAVPPPPPTRVATPRPDGPRPPPVTPVRPPLPNGVAAARGDYVPDEVLFELRPNQPGNTADAIAAQYRLGRIAAERIDLLDTTIYRYRVPGGRQGAAVAEALRGDPRIASAQRNGKYRLQGSSTAPSLQWSADKLQLAAVHGVTTGKDVLIAMIDSGIDVAHPELDGSGIRLLDALETPFVPHDHGTAIAGALSSHGQLTGVAPGARVLGVRTFDTRASAPGAEGTSIHIAKALDLADRAKARIFNLSFAGPSDALLSRMFAALHQKGAVIVAAAGNGGPTSPPLYPGADPNVIAVTATDAGDALYGLANRGPYICIAAPGVDILEPAPGASYQLTSGTSIAAAEVSGIVALLLSRDPDLSPDAVRQALVETADVLASGAKPEAFGSGLVDAVRAVHRFDPAAPAVSSADVPATSPPVTVSTGQADAPQSPKP